MKQRKSLFFLACLVLGIPTMGCPQSGTGIRGSILVDGIKRTYLIHVPPSYSPDSPVPLLIALHPFAVTGIYMQSLTGFDAIANSEGFIVVYPDGKRRHWNADPTPQSTVSALGKPADDVAFISALIDKLAADYAIDPKRVYVAGASNGALMTHRLACELTDRLAAVAAVMTTLPVGWEEAVSPSSPLPILMIQGIDDPFFPWEGGTVQQGPFLSSQYQSMSDTVGFWIQNNAAQVPPVTEALPDTAGDDGTTAAKDTYSAGPGGAEVVLISVDGGGHTWPGGDVNFPESLVGKTSFDFEASQVVWDFLKQHAQP
ncbi:MAG: alpha/beta hydrolase fold domain-containing protein [Candidatus Hydrogenedentes bacterium]|nr:alpha/beta hydrolase fold domain-containing protein [Candidatus Hydrogenedentota bacterium]